MRHRRHNKRLGRKTGHRRALFAGLVCNLIEEKRIRTTLAKARMARIWAERMITLAKDGSLAARRRAIAVLRQERRVEKLFSEVAPQFKDRAGGYTRIVKLGRRSSDSSEMAVLEWVGIAAVDKRKKPVAQTEDAAKKS